MLLSMIISILGMIKKILKQTPIEDMMEPYIIYSPSRSNSLILKFLYFLSMDLIFKHCRGRELLEPEIKQCLEAFLPGPDWDYIEDYHTLAKALRYNQITDDMQCISLMLILFGYDAKPRMAPLCKLFTAVPQYDGEKYHYQFSLTLLEQKRKRTVMLFIIIFLGLLVMVPYIWALFLIMHWPLIMLDPYEGGFRWRWEVFAGERILVTFQTEPKPLTKEMYNRIVCARTYQDLIEIRQLNS